MQSNPSLPRSLSLPSVSVPWRRVNVGLVAVLALASALFLWRLSISGWSNTYYVQLSETSSDLGAWVKAHGKVVSGSLYRVTA